MNRSTPALALALSLAFLPRTGFAQPTDEAPLPDLSAEPNQEETPPAPEPTESLDTLPKDTADETPESENTEKQEAPSPAPIPEARPAPEPDPEPTPSSPPDWNLNGGYRLTLVTSAGFDPFATNDALSQATLSLGRVFHRQDGLSVAGVFTFDVGGRDATARGEATSISALSFALGPEGRYQLAPRARLHLRPSFVVSHFSTSIEESSSQATLHANDWLFGFEAVAGGSVELGELSANVGFALLAEAGYAWTTAGSLLFQPDGDDGAAPLRSEPLDLGELALRGATFRIAASFTF